MRRLALIFPAMLLALLLLAAPPAQATTVQATLCTVNTFPCPVPNILDQGIRANGVGVLGFNRFSLLPFVFTDAAVNFTGTILVTDVVGPNGSGIYVWGGGVGSTNAIPPPAGWYLDVIIAQTYQTVPTIGAPFSEFNNGTCNAATIGTGSGVAATLGVNGAFMPVMGVGFANCPAFNLAGGPFAFNIGGLTTLTALAQFWFDPAGGAGQAIDLPWGEQFPDIVDFPQIFDPGNIGTFAGLTEAAPEPVTFTLIGGALVLGALASRRRTK